MSKKPKQKKEFFFNRILNRVLKLPLLKCFDLSVGVIKGFQVKVEFFEKKGENNNG